MCSVTAVAAWRILFATVLAACLVEGSRTSSPFDGFWDSNQLMTKEKFLEVAGSFWNVKAPSAKQLLNEPDKGYAPPTLSGWSSIKNGYDTLRSEKQKQYGDWLVKVFDTASKMSFPAKVDALGRHPIEYASLLVEAFAFPESGGEMESDFEKFIQTKNSVKLAVEEDWMAVPKNSEVVRGEDFIKYFLDKYKGQIPGDPWTNAYTDYLSSLFVTLAPISLDARASKHAAALDKRRFCQAAVLAGEFHFPRPPHALSDCANVQTEVEKAWNSVPKVEGGDRVDLDGFVTYFQGVHGSKFILDPQQESSFKEAFRTHLGKAFDVGKSMMLPAKKTSLGKHCFRSAAMVANEFYFPGSGTDKLGLLT